MKKYEDIINLSRPISKKRIPMPRINRAAQFAPFSALKGHEESIEETARTTQDKIELDEYQKYLINDKLLIIKDNIKNNIKIGVVYFKKDKTKKGGSYIKHVGIVKDIDEYSFILKMKEGININIKDIVKLDIEI